MTVLKFDLDNPRACKGGEADFYGTVQWLAARRNLVTTEQAWIASQLLRQGHKSSMQKIVRDVIRDAPDVTPDKTSSVTLYRHCREHGGRPRLENLAIFVLKHELSELIETDVVQHPDVNDRNITSLQRKDIPGVELEPVYVPPVHHEISNRYPITRVMSLPPPRTMGGEAFTALRGIAIEHIIDVDSIR